MHVQNTCKKGKSRGKSGITYACVEYLQEREVKRKIWHYIMHVQNHLQEREVKRQMWHCTPPSPKVICQCILYIHLHEETATQFRLMSCRHQACSMRHVQASVRRVADTRFSSMRHTQSRLGELRTLRDIVQASVRRRVMDTRLVVFDIVKASVRRRVMDTRLTSQCEETRLVACDLVQAETVAGARLNTQLSS